MADASVPVYSMQNRVETPVYPHEVYGLTDSGSAQIQSGVTRLPPEALSVLVMLDGKRTVGDVEQQLPHLAPEAVRSIYRSLASARLVRELTMAELGEFDVDFDAFLNAAAGDDKPSAGTEASASREAAAGSPLLERNGYYVSIARQSVKARSGKLDALIVEDDPDMSALVQRLLGTAGLSATIAVTRDEALGRLRRAPMPDIVILDVMLPDFNGFDLLKRLKMHPALKTIPVVMLTADARRESIVQGLAAGADGYITKPFDHQGLVRGVKAVLGV